MLERPGDLCLGLLLGLVLSFAGVAYFLGTGGVPTAVSFMELTHAMRVHGNWCSTLPTQASRHERRACANYFACAAELDWQLDAADAEDTLKYHSFFVFSTVDICGHKFVGASRTWVPGDGRGAMFSPMFAKQLPLPKTALGREYIRFVVRADRWMRQVVNRYQLGGFSAVVDPASVKGRAPTITNDQANFVPRADEDVVVIGPGSKKSKKVG